MRSGCIALFAGLTTLAGCNQIFGLDAVILVDAGPDSLPTDAMLPTVSLTTITPTLDSFGHPNHQVEFHALSPAPHIQYGEIGGMLTEYAFAYESDGGVHVPDAYLMRTTDWRLVYTPDGGVPHEVHWHPAADKGFMTELVGADRPAVPAGAKLDVTPASPSGGTYMGGFTKPRVYMTNAWAEAVAPTVAGSTITVDYAGTQTTSQLGPKRAVAPTDDVLLVDFELVPMTNTGCQASKGAVAFQFPVAAGTAMDATPPPWLSQGTNYAMPVTADMSATLATGYAADASDVTQYKAISFVPTGVIPIFQRTALGMPLPLPLGGSLLECNMKLAAGGTVNVATNLPTFKSPNDTGMQASATIQYSLYRSPAMLPLMSIGFVGTLTADATQTNYATLISAPLATAPTIDDIDVLAPPAFASSTVVTLPGTAPTATLAFGTTPPSAIADFYEATLFTLQSGALVPVRKYTFSAAPLVFDRDVLVPGQIYIFEIRGVVGAPGAAQGDFRTWTANQSISLTYTQTFKR